MNVFVYAAVTADKYEHIVYMGDSIQALADKIGLNPSTIYRKFNGTHSNSIDRASKRWYPYFFRKIEIGEETN